MADSLQALVGKTITAIIELSDGYVHGQYRSDDVISIVFDDHTVLVLASWGYEQYSSGIDREILHDAVPRWYTKR